MQRNKTFSIITIICFCSVIFIPIGLVLMWYSTQWSKKRKLILSGIMTVVYVGIVCFLMLFEPNQSGTGSGLPFGSGNQNVESQYESEQQKSSRKAKQSGANPSAKESEDDFPTEKAKLPKKVQKGESKSLGKSFYTIMFFLFMLFIIIWQYLKAKKKTGTYENPYVDTKKYKLPLEGNFKIPTVHFTKIDFDENEKIVFATETTQKNQNKDVKIGNHVWICRGATMLKGSAIGDECVLGNSSMLTKDYSNYTHCILAGNTAKIVKEDIIWEE